MAPREIRFDVAELPPAKSEARSVLAAGHPHHARVSRLLAAARAALPDGGAGEPPLAASPIGLDVTVTAPDVPDSDATNYLGGIADVLEDKRRRGPLPHLGDLADVALYDDDHQLQEVRYRWRPGAPVRYTVRVWVLDTVKVWTLDSPP